MFKPTEIVSGIVNGVILAVYDFVVLTLGPLFAPFFVTRKSRLAAWRTIFRIEHQLTSLTFLFFCTAVVITAYSGFIPTILREFLQITRDTPSLLFILSASVLCTILIDMLCRSLITIRRLALGASVRFSKIRLGILHITFGIGLMMLTSVYFLGLDLISDVRAGFSFNLLISSLAFLPFAISVFHLLKPMNFTPARIFQWALLIPFCYVLTFVSFMVGFIMVVFLTFFIDLRLRPEYVTFFAMNTVCTVSTDSSKVNVETDILLKTELFEALSLNALMANLGERNSSCSS